MSNYKEVNDLYNKWYSHLSKGKKHFMDSYNERATTAKEFRKKKKELNKPLYPKQWAHLTKELKRAKRKPLATPNSTKAETKK